MSPNKPTDLATSEQFSAQELEGMRIVAKMRAKAEALGIPFVGGFMTDDKKYFIAHSEDCDPSQINSVTNQLLGSADGDAE
jgi:selenophosphate synthetase-related protein